MGQGAVQVLTRGRRQATDTDGRAAKEEGAGRTPAGGVWSPADRKGRTRRGRFRGRQGNTMKRIAWMAVAVGLFALVATPALADDQPTARDIQAAVDSYLASASQDATLVGGPGSAGYDQGFWIRGGDFLLRINLTLQARYEYFAAEERGVLGLIEVGDNEFATIPWPGGNLSGFSVPRATLKFSGEAPCNIRYYTELEFGDPGWFVWTPIHTLVQANPGPFLNQFYNYDVFREGWIEWGAADAFNFRMGKILTPNTRQLMVAPELQQFIDISMASAVTGALQPGYTDRNRDYGFMIHGIFGCSGEWQYMIGVTNGDGGDTTRNVLNPLTSDNLGYSARLNWAFLSGIGYTEGALQQNTCQWYGELGAWANYYADRIDGGRSGLFPHTALYDRLAAGLDLALGYGGFSFTGAFTYFDLSGSDIFNDEEWMLFLVQAGFHFPGTAWEIAARWSSYTRTIKGALGDIEPTTNELGFAVNYYLNGHGNKLSLDFSYFDASADGLQGGGYFDMYSGVPLGFNSNDTSYIVRFQWQLAL